MTAGAVPSRLLLTPSEFITLTAVLPATSRRA